MPLKQTRPKSRARFPCILSPNKLVPLSEGSSLPTGAVHCNDGRAGTNHQYGKYGTFLKSLLMSVVFNDGAKSRVSLPDDGDPDLKMSRKWSISMTRAKGLGRNESSPHTCL